MVRRVSTTLAGGVGGEARVAFEVIKSVRRVFEILELFEAERRPLAAKEVAKRLGYPAMSAHALLKSIHQMGYVDFDPPSWTYLPSRNLIALLDWVPDILERERALLAFAKELSEQTSETINISRRVGSRVRFIHGLESRHSMGVSVKVGAMMPVSRSLTGVVSTVKLDKIDRDQLIRACEAGEPEATIAELIARADEIIAELTGEGMVMRCDMLVEGIGAVCLPVLTSDAEELLVVGVAGPSNRIRARTQEHRKALTTLLKKHKIETPKPAA